MKKSNKIILLTGMVLLLAVTAVFNFILTNNTKDADAAVTTGTFFSQFESMRMTNRNQLFLEYETLLASENLTEELRDETVELQLKLMLNMEKELLLETYIKSLGFENAAVVINYENDSVNVFVDALEVNKENSIEIFNILYEQANIKPKNVNIMPTKNSSN